MRPLLYLHCHLFLPLFLQLLFINLLIPPIRTAYNGCYWIDGTLADSFNPCYNLNTVGASMCCQAGQCQPDGLCNQTIVAVTVSMYYWRGACSDYTWQDPACFPIAPCTCSRWLLYRLIYASSTISRRRIMGQSGITTLFYKYLESNSTP